MMQIILFGAALTVCWVGLADAQKIPTHKMRPKKERVKNDSNAQRPKSGKSISVLAPGSDPKHRGEIVCTNIPKETADKA